MEYIYGLEWLSRSILLSSTIIHIAEFEIPNCAETSSRMDYIFIIGKIDKRAFLYENASVLQIVTFEDNKYLELITRDNIISLIVHVI